MARPTPFKIVVSDEDLSWITERVKTTRLPLGKELPAGKEWSHGLPLNTASRLYQFWTNKYDWRKVEARINAELEMYTVPISHGDEQLTVHFAHHVSPHSNAIPLLFIHGWPGNFLEVAPMIRELTHPSSDSEQAYHVVAPSLPGYCFSSYPNKEFGVADMATTLNNLMLALGYDRYIAQGGDWGSIISRVLALDHATHCAGIHLYMMIAGLPSAAWAPLSLARLVFSYATGWWSEYDGRRIARMKWWMDEENGYRAIQGTKPQTLSYALTDSPFGMMCWIRDKLEHLVDDDFVWEDELVITWAMLYVLNGTPGHAEIYKMTMGENEDEIRAYFQKMITIPVGVSLFPKDPMYATRWWADAAVGSNIVLWEQHEKGGHFPSIEKPDLLAKDLRNFTSAAKLAEMVPAVRE